MRKPFIIATIAMTLICASAAFWIISEESAAKKEFEAELEEWRMIGGPESLIDLAPPIVPNDENAAELYYHAVDLLAPLRQLL